MPTASWKDGPGRASWARAIHGRAQAMAIDTMGGMARFMLQAIMEWRDHHG
ncbi:hypothetical protein SXCC_00726 [Gluconacetobacter sp. SXCC-1]|nr:hypothetical protein SXCC_00726 [Gluconacetobacter sp. SXCC-1]